MKNYSRLLSVLLALVMVGVSLGVVSTKASAQAPTAVVTTGALNIRTGPGIQYERITSFYRGTVFTLMARTADARWVKVQAPGGQIGWANARYLTTYYPLWSLPVEGAPVPAPVPSAIGYVTSYALNLRTGPGAFYPQIVALPRGAPVTLLSRNGLWLKVQTQIGQIGWVNSGYLSTSYPIYSLPVEGAPAPPPVPAPYPPPQPVYRTHVVQPGENLFRVGLQYGLSWPVIAAANGIGYPYMIYAGQVLVIP